MNLLFDVLNISDEPIPLFGDLLHLSFQVVLFLAVLVHETLVLISPFSFDSFQLILVLLRKHRFRILNLVNGSLQLPNLLQVLLILHVHIFIYLAFFFEHFSHLFQVATEHLLIVFGFILGIIGKRLLELQLGLELPILRSQRINLLLLILVGFTQLLLKLPDLFVLTFDGDTNFLLGLKLHQFHSFFLLAQPLLDRLLLYLHFLFDHVSLDLQVFTLRSFEVPDLVLKKGLLRLEVFNFAVFVFDVIVFGVQLRP